MEGKNWGKKEKRMGLFQMFNVFLPRHTEIVLVVSNDPYFYFETKNAPTPIRK